MASVDVENSNSRIEVESNCVGKGRKQAGEGLKQYYTQHIHDLQLQVRHKTHNLNRNETNSKVRSLKEELQLLQEPGSYVGEVVKVMGKSKVLVKDYRESKTMGPRWKGKVAEVKALANPISEIVSQLQASLISSNSRGLLSDTSVLLNADVEQTELLKRACFGRPKVTSENNEQWFQLCMEETFYLQYSLKCIKVVDHNDTELNSDELWKHMTSRKENFPILFKAFSHLRTKNWVVRSGSQYGVDFVAYRHHPALVHSEYAVLALSSENGSANGRLRVWSDFHCTLRLCGSVAKTLLILDIETQSCATSPSCLDNYVVQERTITRWSPEQGRETKVTSDPSVK